MGGCLSSCPWRPLGTSIDEDIELYIANHTASREHQVDVGNPIAPSVNGQEKLQLVSLGAYC